MNTQNASNSFGFNRNDLVLIIGESIGENCVNSIKLADELGRSGEFGKVLHLNTVQYIKHLNTNIRSVLGAGFDIDTSPDHMMFLSSPCGNLSRQRKEVNYYTFDCNGGIETLVINSFELAALSYRDREKLIGNILFWVNNFDLTVVIYAQRDRDVPVAGYRERGGFGRLAGVANVVIKNFEDKSSAGKITTDKAKKEEIKKQQEAEQKKQKYDEFRRSMLSGDALYEVVDDPLSDKDDNYHRSETFISPSGEKEVYTESVNVLEMSDKQRAWDEQEIPRHKKRIWFDNWAENKETKRVTAHEEFSALGSNYERTMTFAKKDYDLPTPLPTKQEPTVGIPLKDFLDRFRKTATGSVLNDRVDTKEVAESSFGMAA
jgi:hypothetical protein